MLITTEWLQFSFLLIIISLFLIFILRMASKFQYLAIPDDYSLCNPMIPLPNGPYYYAFGNTPAFDLTEDLDVNGNLDILLLGCGRLSFTSNRSTASQWICFV